MELTFAPRGILQINDARIIYRNFSGEGSKYNREGDRNFALVIPEEKIADALAKEGWNVKVNDRGPNVYLGSGRRKVKLDEGSISMLDNIDIACVNLDIRPYDWEVNDKTGRTAYLQGMEVIQELDRFAADCIEDEARE